MTDERRIDRMAGCSCMGKSMLAAVAVVLAAYGLLNLSQCYFMTDHPTSGWTVFTKRTMRDIKSSFESFKIEYASLPVPSTSKVDDAHLRTRGQMIVELCSLEDAKLNFKKIKFIDLPMVRNRMRGLWQEDSEWVLSDPWGEPYYIILDTNEDNMTANPEFSADQSDPKYAAKYRQIPTLPVTVLIYSSGPDRDSKTWHDNICSWR